MKFARRSHAINHRGSHYRSALRLLDLVKLSVEIGQFDCQATQLVCDGGASSLKLRAALFAARVVCLGVHGDRFRRSGCKGAENGSVRSVR
ncbi:hypothetical protein [Mycobacterium sp. E2733]|uniref:hypothetical protein n=1 Tax=Mycobacterium sp. E2733 TaxID=1834138 RepID=UPI0012EA550C|nr:hypothetical protein [Mycobacterium sp. E2733]